MTTHCDDDDTADPTVVTCYAATMCLLVHQSVAHQPGTVEEDTVSSMHPMSTAALSTSIVELFHVHGQWRVTSWREQCSQNSRTVVTIAALH